LNTPSKSIATIRPSAVAPIREVIFEGCRLVVDIIDSGRE
jgi:hypothetical protein